jgi:hypothetical protein
MKIPVHKLRVGDLAFYDCSLAGLVPCKILSINKTEIRAIVTAERLGYDKNDTLVCVNRAGASDIVPRTAARKISRLTGKAVIENFTVVEDSDA